jgi:phosphoribosyl 1,2-cyclic phosphate phosphodiesterase
MDITILGSAAAEGWPALFCACDTCKRARAAGGKNIRSRAAVQFGPTYRFDFGPDAWYHEAVLGADLSKLEYLFISHSHGDHWQPHELVYLRPPFAHNNTLPLNVYGSEEVIRRGMDAMGSAESVVFNEARPLVPIMAGELIVTPVTASHQVGEHCLNYVVTVGERNVLCAWDTGWYEDEKTWQYLESLQLDCVIMECTCGPVKCERYHMDFEHHLAAKARLVNAGAVSSDCIFVATHFSHNVGLLHDELEHVLNPHGVQVAYDGMRIGI